VLPTSGVFRIQEQVGVNESHASPTAFAIEERQDILDVVDLEARSQAQRTPLGNVWPLWLRGIEDAQALPKRLIHNGSKRLFGSFGDRTGLIQDIVVDGKRCSH
jgi:hypothetical protein